MDNCAFCGAPIYRDTEKKLVRIHAGGAIAGYIACRLCVKSLETHVLTGLFPYVLGEAIGAQERKADGGC